MDKYLGFTGTRRGLTVFQAAQLAVEIDRLEPSSIVHGDCIGADETFHRICSTGAVEFCRVRPGWNRKREFKYRAWCTAKGFSIFTVEEPEFFLERDVKIVEEATFMMACPKGFVEEPRYSGTWYTIRQAKRLHVPCLLIFPDGTTRLEKNDGRD